MERTEVEQRTSVHPNPVRGNGFTYLSALKKLFFSPLALMQITSDLFYLAKFSTVMKNVACEKQCVYT